MMNRLLLALLSGPLLLTACSDDSSVIWECDCLGSQLTFCSLEHPTVTELATGETVSSGCCSATEDECACQDAAEDEGCLCGPDADPCPPP